MSEAENWRQWRVRREERLREPHGQLAVTGIYRLGTEPAPIVAGEPVLWSASPDGKAVVLTAKAEHGLVLDGERIDGTVSLRLNTAQHPQTVTAPDYDILLVPVERDGRPALRVHDPKSPALAAFAGVDVFDYDPAWALEGRFTPYDAPHIEHVLDVEGATRALGLDGTVDFELEDGVHSFQATLTDTGGLWIIFADPTTAQSKPFFRFLDTPAVAGDGSLRLDFNRAYLPPCAASDHYVCPVPPRGNILAGPVRAGELAVRTR